MSSFIPGASFFGRLRRTRDALRSLEMHVPNYIRVLHSDLREFREELIKAIVGAGVAAAAGLMFIAFFSVAIIVSAWESHYRALVAWAVCGVWAGIAAVGFGFAVRTLRGPVPFAKLTTLLLDDFTNLRERT